MLSANKIARGSLVLVVTIVSKFCLAVNVRSQPSEEIETHYPTFEWTKAVSARYSLASKRKGLQCSYSKAAIFVIDARFWRHIEPSLAHHHRLCAVYVLLLSSPFVCVQILDLFCWASFVSSSLEALNRTSQSWFDRTTYKKSDDDCYSH